MRRRAVAVIGAAVAVLAVGVATFVAPSQANAATPLDPTVKPDATLNPGQSVTLTNTTPLFGTESFYHPSECRGHPSTPDTAVAPLACKTYRIALNLDTSPKAFNSVYIEADFDQIQGPGLPLVALGLNPPPINGIDVYVWDKDDHYLGQNYPGVLDPVVGPGDPNDPPPGTASFADPERGSFAPKQKLYDITVNASIGVNRGFSLHLTYSNEIFKSPQEALDLSNPAAPDFTPPPDVIAPSSAFEPPSSVPTLPLAPISADRDIAGIGLGTNQQFNSQQFALPPQTRSIAASGKPPSGLALVLAMLAFPAALGAGAVVVLRRRRRAFVA